MKDEIVVNLTPVENIFFLICEYIWVFVLYFLLIKTSFYSICLFLQLFEYFLGKSDIHIFKIDTIKIEVINT
jgi:hypothetical protein